MTVSKPETAPVEARHTDGFIKAVPWSATEYELRSVRGNRQVCGPADKADALLIEKLWNNHVRAHLKGRRAMSGEQTNLGEPT